MVFLRSIRLIGGAFHTANGPRDDAQMPWEGDTSINLPRSSILYLAALPKAGFHDKACLGTQ